MRLIFVFMALITALTQFSCGSSDEATVVNRTPTGAAPPDDSGGVDTLSEEELAQRLDRLDGQIRSLISNKSCSSDEQCKAIAFGHKPCGGPEDYHIYSTQQTDEATLERLVSAYTAADRRLDEMRGSQSDCEMRCRPQVGCAGGGGGQIGNCTERAERTRNNCVE